MFIVGLLLFMLLLCIILLKRNTLAHQALKRILDSLRSEEDLAYDNDDIERMKEVKDMVDKLAIVSYNSMVFNFNSVKKLEKEIRIDIGLDGE